MKKEFSGYYSPTEDEFKKLWKDGLIVLDTNVLLDLYRLPDSARDELIAVLQILKDRLWIPYQVALEFQKRRLSVIGAERKVTEDALSAANDLIEQICDKVASLQIDKRGLGLSSGPLLDGMKAANEKLTEAIKSVHQSQLDITVTDSVRDRLDLLLEGKIGTPPVNQEDLDILVKDGQDRYDKKIPPGFADADKEKNPNEALFHHDGITYQRKFGDLILWRQIIEYVKKNKIKGVLFITSDRKEDWWWREKGKTIGPRPELAREIIKHAEAHLFWMYSSVQFLESSKKFTKAQVSDLSVTELKEVSRIRSIVDRDGGEERDFTSSDITFREKREHAHRGFTSVKNWLQSKFSLLQYSGLGGAFPDFTVVDEAGLHGFELKNIRKASLVSMMPIVNDALLKGYFSINEDKISRFSLILILEKEFLDRAENVDGGRRLKNRFQQSLNKYGGYEIIYGFVNEGDGKFNPVYTLKYSNDGDDAESWD